MIKRCAMPWMLTYECPPVMHYQKFLLQAFPCNPIQGTACVMMTAAVVSGLLRAFRETNGVFEPSPCHYALTEQLSVDDHAPGDHAVADAVKMYDAIARAALWAAVHDWLPYHHDLTRQARALGSPNRSVPFDFFVGAAGRRRGHGRQPDAGVLGVVAFGQAPTAAPTGGGDLDGGGGWRWRW